MLASEREKVADSLDEGKDGNLVTLLIEPL